MLKHLKVMAGIEKKQKFSFLRSLFMWCLDFDSAQDPL
jgi:hypothetical protein